MEMNTKIGIIGGSGLDDPDILTERKEVFVDTPFGKPSDALIQGKIKGVSCVLLARHGRKHTIMPSNINYRANIWALKEAGCSHIIATNACGSLREDIHPGDIIFPDQFIDWTKSRCSTFYDGSPDSPIGICHIPMHTPFCSSTQKLLIDVTKALGYRHHPEGTIVVIEGPRFSTKAESNLFRSWRGDIIGMTTVPEVVLAKEAGLCYATLAMATDYDCWHYEHQAVNVDVVMSTMKENSCKATQILINAIPKIKEENWDKIINKHKEEISISVMVPH